jgi:uncharacterized membrane protein YczE
MEKTMLLKLARLVIGIVLYAVGIVATINAHLGLSPWDVLHQGIGLQTGITMGQASILVGLAIVFLNFFFKEKVGIGTILNMILIGWFLDIIMINDLLPEPKEMIFRLLMLVMGMFIVGIASYLYIGAGLGAGPRDGIMVALHKKTGKSVRFIRNSIEISVLIIGYFLGGSVGVGTVILSLATGYVIQFVFKVFKFNIKTVKHRYLDEDIKKLLRKR